MKKAAKKVGSNDINFPSLKFEHFYFHLNFSRARESIFDYWFKTNNKIVFAFKLAFNVRSNIRILKSFEIFEKFPVQLLLHHGLFKLVLSTRTIKFIPARNTRSIKGS